MNAAQTISTFWTDGALRASAAQTRAALAAIAEHRIRSFTSLSKAASHYAASWTAGATMEAAIGSLQGTLTVEGGDRTITERALDGVRAAENEVIAKERTAAVGGSRLAMQLACRLVRLAVDMAHGGRHAGALAALCELAERLPEPSPDPRADAAVRALSVLAASLPTEGGQR